MRSFAAATSISLLLSGCAGVSTLHVRALGPERDRPIALAPSAGDGDDQIVHAGVAAGLAKAGIVAGDPSDPRALVLRTRLLAADEEIAGGGALRTTGDLFGSVGKGAVGLLQSGSRAYNASRVRLALVLEARERRKPVGALFWDGFGGGSEAAFAGEEAGEAMGREIARQRERWFTRRVGDERLFLTATPNLIPPGEWVLSNDEALVFHLGRGFYDWLQGDLTLGALPVPVAAAGAIAGGGGAAAGGVAGFGAIGILNLGVKVRVLEEGALLPGVALSYDMVNVWGAAFGAGGVALLGKGVAAAAAGGAAGFNLQFNLLTASVAKHLRDWLQVGAGLYVLDNHSFMPQSEGFYVADTFGNSTSSSSRITDRVPTLAAPWLSVEAAAGNRVRFISEYLFAPGSDWFVLGMRTLMYRTRFGLARAGHVAAKLDTAVLFTRYTEHDTGERRIVPLPWLGLAFYLR